MSACCEEIEQELEERTEECRRLTVALAAALREVEVLRQYGNKDCTAMADEVLEGEEE